MQVQQIGGTQAPFLIHITAEVRVEFAREYKGKGPVPYPIEITPAEKPEDKLVYFS